MCDISVVAVHGHTFYRIRRIVHRHLKRGRRVGHVDYSQPITLASEIRVVAAHRHLPRFPSSPGVVATDLERSRRVGNVDDAKILREAASRFAAFRDIGVAAAHSDPIDSTPGNVRTHLDRSRGG